MDCPIKDSPFKDSHVMDNPIEYNLKMNTPIKYRPIKDNITIHRALLSNDLLRATL